MRLVGRLGSVSLTSLTLALSWSTSLADRDSSTQRVSVLMKVSEIQTRNGTFRAC